MGFEGPEESEPYLREQIITYLGNKRKLLSLIGEGVQAIRKRLGGRKLGCLDAFSGSGIVSRYLKRHAHTLYSNDLEEYATVLNRCYLANAAEVAAAELPRRHAELLQQIAQHPAPGLIAELYAPKDDADIHPGERVFYTRHNAVYLDTARRAIGQMPPDIRHFFLAPLLYLASVHTNTSGVFKGFHKNAQGVGQFGGRGKNALQRILAEMQLPLPVFSRFDCEVHLSTAEATAAAKALPQEIDLAYLDPPYNQHPYGSNYFMFNLLLRNERPAAVSPVSGIPQDWNRSAYNNRHRAKEALAELLRALPARFALLSYNSEGYLTTEDIQEISHADWKLSQVEQEYATFRGCRNLRARPTSVKEYLFVMERK